MKSDRDSIRNSCDVFYYCLIVLCFGQRFDLSAVFPPKKSFFYGQDSLTPVDMLRKLSGQINGQMRLLAEDKSIFFFKFFTYFFLFCLFAEEKSCNFGVKWHRGMSERSPLEYFECGQSFLHIYFQWGEGVGPKTLISSFHRKMLFIARDQT